MYVVWAEKTLIPASAQALYQCGLTKPASSPCPMHTNCLFNSASLINGVLSIAKCFVHMRTNEENGMGNEPSGWFQEHQVVTPVALHW